MEPLEFLAVALPSRGVYCVAELSSKKKEHYFDTDLGVAYEVARQFADSKKDTFYALASFIDDSSREAENALFMRSACPSTERLPCTHAHLRERQSP